LSDTLIGRGIYPSTSFDYSIYYAKTNFCSDIFFEYMLISDKSSNEPFARDFYQKTPYIVTK